MIRAWLTFLMLLIALPAHAAISYVGGQCGGFAGVTSPQTITFTLAGGSDAAPITGDFVIVSYATGSAGDRTLIVDNPSGTDYTLFGTELLASDSFSTNLRTGYRVMPNPTETTVDLSATFGGGGTGSTNDAGSYCIQVFRGVHATPLEQAVQEGTGTNTNLVNAGTITPTTAGTFVVVVGAGTNSGTSSYSSSDLTNFLYGGATDTNSSTSGIGYLQWSSGAFDPAAWTFGGGDNTANSYAWKTIALAPAEAPVPSLAAPSAGASMLLLGF